ncbi:MAG: chemotaxis protein CheB, partial [Candidatus Omnitrophota bacterium]
MRKKNKIPTHHQKNYFPIVCIGGSAGGLEAFEDLLKNISNRPQMALVFIMHLAPGYKSLLPELLARLTKMPVSEITSGMIPEINHIYVKPSNASLVLYRGKLMLSALEPGNVKRMPIDTFFRSLANELGNRSIGVILSGTATDGTLGAEAIKAEGGITFAQDAKTAKYNDMPHSAISAGCVDFVFSPKKIAAELMRIAKQPFILSPVLCKIDKTVITKNKSFEIIFDILRRAKGLDFTYYKHPTVLRRVSRRIILTKQGNLKNYVKFLRESKNEAGNLYEDLLINVTGFFRDKKVFQALEKSIIPKIIKSKAKDEGIRVWVPGCSSGEEAYSIAMLFVESLRQKIDGFPLQIFATDASDKSIHKARRGVYGPSI